MNTTVMDLKAAKAAEKAAKADAKAAAKAAEKAAKAAEKAAAKAAEKAAKAAAKVAEKAAKAAEKASNAGAKVSNVAAVLLVTDITHFFTTSAKSDNDATNKIREKVLAVAPNPPAEFLTDPTHGPSWAKLRDEFNAILKKITPEPWTHVNITTKAGRGHKFDFSVEFYNEIALIATKKLEFKKGAATIKALPQFLSLPTSNLIMPGLKYHEYFYDHGLDAYLATDAGLTAAKPTKEEYCKLVSNTSETCHPLFTQMKARKGIQTAAKNAVVNKSVKDYLDAHGTSVDIAAFAKKVAETQTDKHYVLWSNGTFHYDHFAATEMTGFAYSHIKNGNVLVITAPGCSYELLLRWRNGGKGVLNPAWQIKMKRI